jgi:hypothetical protein
MNLVDNRVSLILDFWIWDFWTMSDLRNKMKQKTPNASKGVEQWETSFIDGGNVKWDSLFLQCGSFLQR